MKRHECCVDLECFTQRCCPDVSNFVVFECLWKKRGERWIIQNRHMNFYSSVLTSQIKFSECWICFQCFAQLCNICSFDLVPLKQSIKTKCDFILHCFVFVKTMCKQPKDSVLSVELIFRISANAPAPISPIRLPIYMIYKKNNQECFHWFNSMH